MQNDLKFILNLSKHTEQCVSIVISRIFFKIKKLDSGAEKKFSGHLVGRKNFLFFFFFKLLFLNLLRRGEQSLVLIFPSRGFFLVDERSKKRKVDSSTNEKKFIAVIRPRE